jgi:hypothetical protein
MFGTSRGVSILAKHTLIAFGLMSGLIQLYTALWPNPGLDPLAISASVVMTSVIWGCSRSWPRAEVRHQLRRPNVRIRVLVGDLFEQHTHLVIGFTDVFDTDIATGEVIDPRSIQGQFQRRIYGGDTARLDQDLKEALRESWPHSTEDQADKPRGKLDRYPVGTTAVLGDQNRRFFCVAYSEMRNDLVASSSVDHLWNSLNTLWNAVHSKGQLGTVSMPVIGTDLARISQLDHESILKMILLSFIARTREKIFCKELVVTVRREDFAKVNMLEIKAFLSRV